MIEFYRQFMGKGDLVFDVGANIGERTEVFRDLALRVVAIEPVESTFAKLAKKFATDSRVTLVNMACGPKGGEDEIAVSSTEPLNQLASMSTEWIAAVRETKRFGGTDRWSETEVVDVVTLDLLIADRGEPAFIKIDVEGYELPVLQGLSKPVKALSFEFTPERFEEAAKCVARCKELGMTQFNFSPMADFTLGKWTNWRGIADRLSKHVGDSTLYGDIYARRP